MSERRHLIGLLLGTEDDWSTTFEWLVEQLPPIERGGETHTFETERITIEPFDLRAKPRHSLVIDRLGWWYHVPREWLKKVALMDDVYLLNSPFTFQAMEKHSAYCAMMRLGLKVPETWLIPHKKPPDNPRFFTTASRYNQPFSVEEVGAQVGFPLFMKPFDGGQWVGVSRAADAEALRRAYDASGERLMHVQASIEDFDVFVRSLSIGAETLSVRYEPDRPLHERYAVEHDFLTPEVGREVVTISRVVNAFFRWEFNSCETIVKDGEVYPIDYANASPDVSLISLGYYFPWAIRALVRWCAFCTVTGRRSRVVDMDSRRYFDVASGPYEERLERYRALADEDLDVVEYDRFCAEHLPDLDAITLELVASERFDSLLADTVRATFPSGEHEAMLARYRGLVGAWVHDQRALVET
ncbi:MAG TPA: hypothetical protein VGF23_08935 [Gaiellaceae bacterium]